MSTFNSVCVFDWETSPPFLAEEWPYHRTGILFWASSVQMQESKRESRENYRKCWGCSLLTFIQILYKSYPNPIIPLDFRNLKRKVKENLDARESTPFCQRINEVQQDSEYMLESHRQQSYPSPAHGDTGTRFSFHFGPWHSAGTFVNFVIFLCPWSQHWGSGSN